MVESTGSSHAHQELLTLKENILAQWSRLPAEHQATMLLVLVERVKAGQFGAWAAQAIELLSTPHEPPVAASAIPQLTPQDLARHTDLAPDEIASLTDDDLRDISVAVMAHLVYDVFWNEVEYLAQQRLDNTR
ncbi:MAG TPA: hypothetical protein PKD55_15220 [Bellilinea sp.]|nr:hypothetical protein [Bellilinea sp.]